MSAIQKSTTKKYTPDEFFDFLDSVTEKYEFEDGEIIKMTGGSGNHNVIKADLGVFLGGHALRNTDCDFFDSDQAVYIPGKESYVFPDLSFVCEEARYEDEARRRLINPTLLIEVLSESTEAYDRGSKFHKYRSLDSFREYVLVDSRSYLVECFYKEDDRYWRIDSCLDPYGSVRIHTLGIDLPLSAMYRRVDFLPYRR